MLKTRHVRFECPNCGNSCHIVGRLDFDTPLHFRDVSSPAWSYDSSVTCTCCMAALDVRCEHTLGNPLGPPYLFVTGMKRQVPDEIVWPETGETP